MTSEFQTDYRPHHLHGVGYYERALGVTTPKIWACRSPCRLSAERSRISTRLQMVINIRSWYILILCTAQVVTVVKCWWALQMTYMLRSTLLCYPWSILYLSRLLAEETHDGRWLFRPRKFWRSLDLCIQFSFRFWINICCLYLLTINICIKHVDHMLYRSLLYTKSSTYYSVPSRKHANAMPAAVKRLVE